MTKQKHDKMEWQNTGESGFKSVIIINVEGSENCVVRALLELRGHSIVGVNQSILLLLRPSSPNLRPYRICVTFTYHFWNTTNLETPLYIIR
jgi:hypothetical protein